MTKATLDQDSLWQLLGGAPDQRIPEVIVSSVRVDDACNVIETISLNGISATLIKPENLQKPAPAILYCHAHGGEFSLGRHELLNGARWTASPFGPDFARRGYIVLCLDMPGFGDRQHEGTESSLSKAALWSGRTLMGDMLCDLSLGLDYLASHPDVRPESIASFGISMGAAHAFLLAALDARISSAAQICMLANIERLIASGGHDRHGHFLTIPGLLKHGDMGDIAAMIAPRPQFVGLGGKDALCPADATDPALKTLIDGYKNTPHNLTIHIEPESGHCETPNMRRAVRDFFGNMSD